MIQRSLLCIQSAARTVVLGHSIKDMKPVHGVPYCKVLFGHVILRGLTHAFVERVISQEGMEPFRDSSTAPIGTRKPLTLCFICSETPAAA